MEPLYTQVREKLRTGIASGEWKPGARLPNEDRLAAMFGVSRVTVRKAVAQLCEEGLLKRAQGAGTFVRGQMFEFSLASEDLGSVVDDASFKRLFSRAYQAGQAEIKAFNLRGQSTTIEQASRIMAAEGSSLAIQTFTLPHAWFPFKLRQKISGGKMLLPDSEFPPPLRVCQTARAVPPTKKQVALLGLPGGCACLMICREVFAAEGLLYRVETLVDGRRVVLG